MHHRLLACALAAWTTLATTAPLHAHGGQYRGPEDIVPPGGHGGRTPGPSGGPGGGPTTGPRTPGGGSLPGGPTTGTGGQPGNGGTGQPGRTPGRGAQLSEDFSRWSYWWEFNKHAYLGLREAVLTGGVTTGLDEFYLGATKKRLHDLVAPSRQQIQNEILPALKRAIDSTEQRDIVSSCLVAMAKIGADHPEFVLADVFRPRLARNNQEIRETAALSFGIAALPTGGALDTLCDLALDTPRARALGGDRSPGMRTRSFALYALGLFGSEHADLAVTTRIFETLRQVMQDDSISNHNLKVAAIQATSLLSIDTSAAAGRDLLDDALDLLANYFDREVGIAEQVAQAHCPTAIVRLLAQHPVRAETFRKRFASELSERRRDRRNDDLPRSCVLALGELCQPRVVADSPDADYSELLTELSTGHRDAQTRYFSLLALGRIGGKLNRDVLLKVLRKGNKTLERPWAALALGVLAHAECKAAEAADRAVLPDRIIGDALVEQLDQAKNPELVGALGVALGLCRYKEAAAKLERAVVDAPHKEQQAGYLCLGLGLMRARTSIETIRVTLADATYRPRLFVQAAIALGLLGDRAAANQLHERIADENSNLAVLSSVATAIGKIGDRSSVSPLTRILFDDQRGDLQRAFAAVGLGAVADRALLPWHAKISTNLNYRASVETLVNQQSGVLDIL